MAGGPGALLGSPSWGYLKVLRVLCEGSRKHPNKKKQTNLRKPCPEPAVRSSVLVFLARAAGRRLATHGGLMVGALAPRQRLCQEIRSFFDFTSFSLLLLILLRLLPLCPALHAPAHVILSAVLLTAPASASGLLPPLLSHSPHSTGRGGMGSRGGGGGGGGGGEGGGRPRSVEQRVGCDAPWTKGLPHKSHQRIH